MSKPSSKIKFGFKNAFYAKITESDGVISYGTPKALKGAVSMSLSPAGESLDFYADDMLYFGEEVNDGYDGTLELALIPEDFRADILGETVNADGVYEESATAVQGSFALLCECATDQKGRKFAFYNCRASRTDIAGSTKTASKEVQTETLNLKIRPDANGIVQRHTGDDTTDAVLEAWYTAVYQPTVSA